MTYDEARKGLLFRYLSGSRCYGTHTPESDYDYRGVFVAPLSATFDLFHSAFMGQGDIPSLIRRAIDDIDEDRTEQAKGKLNQALAADQGDLSLTVGEVQGPEGDEELYELRKFMSLLAKNNPNILECLYVERGVTHTSPEWELIRANRSMFLSKKVKFTFSGYGLAQLHRIKTHRRFLLNPPSHKPTRQEFGLPETSTVAKEHRNAAMSLPDSMVRGEIKETIIAEKRYSEAMKSWEAYQKWDKERNPKRRELERKSGFDTKFAMHLIRLIRMAEEILRDGRVVVHRPDAEELLAIRNGAWTYDQVVEYADGADERLQPLYESSPLRDKPDHQGISDLFKAICRMRSGLSI